MVLSQLSVGSVDSATPVLSVTVSLESSGRTWRVVARARGAVGDRGVAPYLLALMPAGRRAYAVRVTVITSSGALVTYVNAIGPAHPG